MIARAKTDPRAFTPLYAHYFEAVHSYCRRGLRDPEAAADATSQVFAQALAALPHYRAGSFRSWLFTIAHNVMVDAIRRHHLHTPLEDAAEVVDKWPTPEEQALAAEEQRTLMELLAELTPDQRRVIELRLAGLSGQEVAAVLNQSLSAVKSLQFRAAARLRKLLAFDGPNSQGGNTHAPR